MVETASKAISRRIIAATNSAHRGSVAFDDQTAIAAAVSATKELAALCETCELVAREVAVEARQTPCMPSTLHIRHYKIMTLCI